MKYEILDMEIVNVDSCDVITTSSNVTADSNVITGDIKFPWQI